MAVCIGGEVVFVKAGRRQARPPRLTAVPAGSAALARTSPTFSLSTVPLVVSRRGGCVTATLAVLRRHELLKLEALPLHEEGIIVGSTSSSTLAAARGHGPALRGMMAAKASRRRRDP